MNAISHFKIANTWKRDYFLVRSNSNDLKEKKYWKIQIRAFKLVQVFGFFLKSSNVEIFLVMSTFELSLNDHWKFQQFAVNVINSFAL